MEVEAVTCGPGATGAKRGRTKPTAGDALEPPDAKRRALALTAPPPPTSAALAPWAPQQQHPPSSRIYRVSRASGGKDRHSKVYTAKGIRDRRVRLSVATAIQFYDLQDRLGYDQPSKAVEWLIRAAADAIDRLPSLDAAAGFPAHPASAHHANAAAKDHLDGHNTPPGGADDDEHQQHEQLTKSGCSSTSETSKGSVLSLSRSESRVKARERARERSAVAAAKDKDPGSAAANNRAAGTTASAQAASFTELLTGMAAAAAAAPAEHKQQHHHSSTVSWGQPQPTPTAVSSAVTTDYIGFAQPRKGGGHAMAHSFVAPAPHLANIASIAMAPAAQHFGLASGAVTVASGAGEPHAEMTHFSFLQDHFMPVHTAPAPAPAVEYNLNFSMSSGLVGVNSRGTLQSNSQPHISGHHHHHQQQQLQRLSTPLDAPNIPFLFSPPAAAAAAAVPATAEGQFASFQLWNGFQHADNMKEKGKN